MGKWIDKIRAKREIKDQGYISSNRNQKRDNLIGTVGLDIVSVMSCAASLVVFTFVNWLWGIIILAGSYALIFLISRISSKIRGEYIWSADEKTVRFHIGASLISLVYMLSFTFFGIWGAVLLTLPFVGTIIIKMFSGRGKKWSELTPGTKIFFVITFVLLLTPAFFKIFWPLMRDFFLGQSALISAGIGSIFSGIREQSTLFTSADYLSYLRTQGTIYEQSTSQQSTAQETMTFDITSAEANPPSGCYNTQFLLSAIIENQGSIEIEEVDTFFYLDPEMENTACENVFGVKMDPDTVIGNRSSEEIIVELGMSRTTDWRVDWDEYCELMYGSTSGYEGTDCTQIVMWRDNIIEGIYETDNCNWDEECVQGYCQKQWGSRREVDCGYLEKIGCYCYMGPAIFVRNIDELQTMEQITKTVVFSEPDKFENPISHLSCRIYAGAKFKGYTKSRLPLEIMDNEYFMLKDISLSDVSATQSYGPVELRMDAGKQPILTPVSGSRDLTVRIAVGNKGNGQISSMDNVILFIPKELSENGCTNEYEEGSLMFNCDADIEDILPYEDEGLLEEYESLSENYHICLLKNDAISYQTYPCVIEDINTELDSQYRNNFLIRADVFYEYLVQKPIILEGYECG